MGDLYHIPNDDGYSYRLKKFVEYQHEAPEIHWRFLREWIYKKNLSNNESVNMCWFLSVTYNEITSVFLEEIYKRGEEDWGAYEGELIFGSARKYISMNGRFTHLMKEWDRITRGEPYLWLKSLEEIDPRKTLQNVSKELMSIKEVGRMATDLFLELLIGLRVRLRYNICQPKELDWKHCANLTSGTYNIFYEDERAEAFDKTGRIGEGECEILTQYLYVIQQKIRETYPEQDCGTYSFLGKICSFRNLFKKARYGGFHHDRELGWIRQYEQVLPQYSYLWRECLYLRREIFPGHLLGELNGWDGIRKERKRLWVEKGLTGVEKESIAF